MSDYELQISVKNAPLLNLMRKNGITKLTQLAELADVGYQQLCNFANLKMTIYNARGEVRPTPAKVSDFFNVMPEELAPEPQHYTPLSKNKVKVQLNAEQMFALTNQTEIDPVALFTEGEMQKNVHKMLEHLTPREKKVLKKRYFEEQTFREIAENMGVSTERIQQIEEKAMRNVRRNMWNDDCALMNLRDYIAE